MEKWIRVKLTFDHQVLVRYCTDGNEYYQYFDKLLHLTAVPGATPFCIERCRKSVSDPSLTLRRFRSAIGLILGGT